MSKPIIRVEGLSKQYRIGARERAYKTIRESLMDAVIAPFRRINGHPQCAIRNPHSEYIWALKDVSFDVQPGEVLGIIGRNGAGKSTLLKILSRITEPTEGRAKVGGRVGSLLEVGTGFHHELTGRENVYLNGAILGMRKAEIDRKFDEIVAFSEVEKFIDTPVKRYSSGMYVRLAFAVAAHLEPEILIVDEVLAVGDAGFQKKCLGKMDEVAHHGRTVLLVSHNMAAIEGLCDRAVWLDTGNVRATGPSRDIIVHYSRANNTTQDIGPGLDLTGRLGNQRARIASAQIIGHEGGNGAVFMGEPFQLTLEIFAEERVRGVNIYIEIFSLTGIKLLSASIYRQNLDIELPSGNTRWVCDLQTMPLRAGIYTVQLGVCTTWEEDEMDVLPQALKLEVLPKDVLGSGRLLDHTGGLTFTQFQWRQTELDDQDVRQSPKLLSTPQAR